MYRASTSKKSRRAARLSLRPNPSAPSVIRWPGNQADTVSGSAFT